MRAQLFSLLLGSVVAHTRGGGAGMEGVVKQLADTAEADLYAESLKAAETGKKMVTELSRVRRGIDHADLLANAKVAGVRGDTAGRASSATTSIRQRREEFWFVVAFSLMTGITLVLCAPTLCSCCYPKCLQAKKSKRNKRIAIGKSIMEQPNWLAAVP